MLNGILEQYAVGGCREKREKLNEIVVHYASVGCKESERH